MTETFKPKSPHNPRIAAGPAVQCWHCPGCNTDVPRLLPNGQLNRHDLAAGDLYLDEPAVRAALGTRAGDGGTVCLGCRDAFRQLLGTLVVPAGTEGDLLGREGEPDTTIIAAIRPVAGREPRLLLFGTDSGGRPELREDVSLADFNPERMTYPGTQGEIEDAIWSMYQREIARLQAQFAGQHTD